jgi:8-oxo-dGTP pyrophosphatase MutT (NUDIX family)
MSLRPASTVMLLRPSPASGNDFEVFLVQRSRAVGFMPMAWVFPGGKVDAEDLELDADNAPPGGGFRVAAAREVFEESGLWLGETAPPDDARLALHEGRTTFAELIAAYPLDLGQLKPWSHWITPVVEPRRFDTWFFVATVGDAAASHDTRETVASGWYRPAQAMELAAAGELPMAPPTWWTLSELARHGSLASVFAAERPLFPIEPMVARVDDGFVLRLPGHPEHPAPAIPEMPIEIRYLQGRWWAER